MKYFLLFLILVSHFSGITQTTVKPLIKTVDLKIFEKDNISDGFINRDMAISKDGSQLFYTMQHRNTTYGTYSVIMQSFKTSKGWSKPEVAPFSGKYNDLEPAFSADGKKLFFVSSRTMSDTGGKKDYDIWYVEKIGNKWSEAKNIGSPVNTNKDEFYPSLANNGNLYFTRDNGSTKEDIMMAVFNNNKFDSIIVLSQKVNSPGFDFNAFVDPAEKFIIFTSVKRTDDIGGGDLYMSFKKDGEWQQSFNIGSLFNSKVLDYCPYVSPDKKYLFFTSGRSVVKFPFEKQQTAGELKRVLSSAGNGTDDIYYVDFNSFISSINKKE